MSEGVGSGFHVRGFRFVVFIDLRVLVCARYNVELYTLKPVYRIKMVSTARKIYTFIINGLYELLGRTGISIRIAMYKLRRDTRNCKSLEDYVDFVFTFNNRFPFRKLNIQPLQVKPEILDLLNILNEKKPKIILEIGTAKGGTLYLWSRIAAPDAKIISVDLPEGPFGGGYPKWRMPLYRSFARDNQKIYLIRANSHSSQTVLRVEKILDGNKIDFLFIDGDHTYEGVKEDFETYTTYANKKGIVAFHDIVENKSDEIWQVYRFWKEIKQDYNHQEIISEKRLIDRSAGIGVIFLETEGT